MNFWNSRVDIEGQNTSILLVGGTQNGKSSLANFLYYNDKYKKVDAIFPVGDGSQSCTKNISNTRVEFVQVVQSGAKDIKNIRNQITIVDTPGAGDTNRDESSNMVKFYKFMEGMKRSGTRIGGVVICCKFGVLINEEFKTNLKFYKAMLSSIISKNVTLVITGFSEDEEWQEEMETIGGGAIQQLERFTNNVLSEMELKRDVVNVYRINAFPIRKVDIEHAQRVRSAIFNNALTIFVSPSDLAFPLPLDIQRENNKLIESLDGEMKGMREGWKIAGLKIDKASKKLLEIEGEIAQTDSDIKLNESKLAKYDNQNLILIKTEKLTDSWKFVGSSSKSFSVNTVNVIREYKLTQGYFDPLRLSATSISGTVWNGWFKSLSSELKLYTYSSDYYSDEISRVKRVIEGLLAKRKEQIKSRDIAQSEVGEEGSVQKGYRLKIAEINSKISELKKTSMTYNEMLQFIKKYK